MKAMNYDDEILGRYIDGDLDPRSTMTLETAIAGDSALAARLVALREVSMKLRGEFADVLSEEVPERLRQAVLATPTDMRSISASPGRGLFAGWRMPVFASGAAGAAGLALGLAIAPASVLAMDEDGHLVARGTLAVALEDGLASMPEGPAAIGVSFRDRDGAWCRSFESRAAEAGLAGLACVRDGVWRIEVAEAVPLRSADYAQASAAMPDSVRAAIAARQSGEPLDAAGERAARDAGWK